MAYRQGNYVSLNWDDEVNLDQIRRYKYINDGSAKQGEGKVRVWWANGDTEVLPITGDEGIRTDNYYVIPAAPGFELLMFWPTDEGEGEEVLERLPVIAWRIDEYQTGERLSDSNPIAISLNSTSFENDTAVRCPSGRVTIYENGRVFENEEKWIEWIREKRTEKKEAAE